MTMTLYIKFFHKISAIFLIVCFFATILKASTPDELILGIDDSRTRIVSGIFTISGTTTEFSQGIENKKVLEDCYVVFDYNKGFYRFDRKGKGKYLVTPDCTFERLQNNPSSKEAIIIQHSRDYKPNINICPFDIRSLGFFACVGNYYNFNYNDFRLFLTQNIKPLDTKDGVLAYIAFIHKNANDSNKDIYPTYKIWVDKKNNYATSRIEVGTTSISELTWKNIGDTYVPVTFRQRYNSVNSGLKVDADWVLTWEMVNDVIPPKLFTYQNLKDKDDEYGNLYSGDADRSKTPVPLESFGKKEINVISPSTNTSKILMAIGIAMMLIGLGRMGYDRWIRKSQT
jgi:hypothetical protein